MSGIESVVPLNQEYPANEGVPASDELQRREIAQLRGQVSNWQEMYKNHHCISPDQVKELEERIQAANAKIAWARSLIDANLIGLETGPKQVSSKVATLPLELVDAVLS